MEEIISDDIEVKVEPIDLEEVDVKVEPEEAGTSQSSGTHFPCSDCHLVYSKYIYLMRHKKQKHGIHVDLTKLDGDVDSEPIVSSETPEKLDDKSCHVCGKVMTARDKVRRHMNSVHSGVKPFECEICRKRFSEKGSLIRHSRIHTGAKPFVCKQCNKAFNDSSNFKTHVLHHLGVKNFKCDECGRAFAQSGHLKAHMRSHIGEKPFMCDVCKKTFSSSSQFVLHRRTHDHDADMYLICSSCSFRTTDDAILKVHIVQAHDDVDIESDRIFIASCENCGRMFTKDNSIKRHTCYT